LFAEAEPAAEGEGEASSEGGEGRAPALLRRGMQAHIDYELIPEEAWELIKGWYGKIPFNLLVRSINIKIRIS